jgi:FtsP/CotA-like multicopper oxidase with cupredoxin domain
MRAAILTTALGAVICSTAMWTPARAAGETRTYYIAAHEVEWNYAPGGVNRITGKRLPMTPRNAIGLKYRKAVYDEYTDGSFSQLKPRPSYFGILGPVIRAEVGDTIVVHFKNATRFPQSMHPHGVLYAKASEGAPYQPAAAGVNGNSVRPGATFRYEWAVPERAGPDHMDVSSVLWMYHSHVDEVAGISTGLIGPLVISRKGSARPDGSPSDVDREIFTLFALEDENTSNYMAENFKRIRDVSRITPQDRNNPVSPFYATNEIPSINGFVFGTLPMPVMRQGEHVRWYLIGNGSDALDYHTPHWHGNVASSAGMRTDVVQLLPGGMTIADMTPDNPGTWLFHCHVSFHMLGGMIARYQVLPALASR